MPTLRAVQLFNVVAVAGGGPVSRSLAEKQAQRQPVPAKCAKSVRTTT